MTTVAEPRQAASATAMLIHLIVKRLLPMFLMATDGDESAARGIAIETVNAHCARNGADVLAIAQIIACGMASLDNVILSLADDISHSLRLRLQSNANAMNRVIEQNRRFLRQDPPAPSDPWHWPEDAADEAPIQAAPTQAAPTQAAPIQAAPTKAAPAEASALEPEAAGPAAEAKGPAAAMPGRPMPKPPNMPAQPVMPQPAMPKPAVPASAKQAPAMTEQEKAMIWAGSMNRVAAEYTASIPHLPPVQRRAATMRANALSSTANALIARALPTVPG